MRGRPARPRRAAAPRGNTPAGAGTTAPLDERWSGAREHPRGCGDDTADSARSPNSRGTPPRVRGRREAHRLLGPLRGNTPAGAGTTQGEQSSERKEWEHPRGCGDDARLQLSAPAKGGTPPRVRGRPPGRSRSWTRCRNTPAGAGTTLSARNAAPEKPEHPRGCGDDVKRDRVESSWLGTPPRVRGRRGGDIGGPRGEGNTPAGAGTTLGLGSGSCQLAEHPRGCGDDVPGRSRPDRRRGTPPRVRGRPTRAVPVLHRRGNTPAGAGTTACRDMSARQRWEHPRGCGDDLRRVDKSRVREGTPPRVRGRRRRCRQGRSRTGNTPAGAGTTHTSTTSTTRLWEHPRGCGDDRPKDPPGVLARGTPPRVRGRPPDPQTVVASPGNTPAGAGTTRPLRARRSRAGEHPRGCGDDGEQVDQGAGPAGTPPRVRGRPLRDRSGAEHRGNTPAGAGTTIRSGC